MAITVNATYKYNMHTMGFDCAADLSALQYCAVGLTASAASAGLTTACKVTAQGARAIGILQNAPVYGTDMAEVQMDGTCHAKAYDTFNSYAELTPHDTNGKLETASSGDYVVAISLESATCADALVCVKLCSTPYYKG